MSENTIRVIAAVICDQGQWLLGRRPSHKRHGGLWEFPGGKVEPDESVLDAVTRELSEELGLTVTSIGQCLARIRDADSPFVIEFTETEVKGQPQAMEHEVIAWFDLEQLLTIELAPSDQRFVLHLREQYG